MEPQTATTPVAEMVPSPFLKWRLRLAKIKPRLHRVLRLEFKCGVITALAGLVIWSIAFGAQWLAPTWGTLWTIPLLLLLLMPAGFMFLVYIGLTKMLELPALLIDETRQQAQTLKETVQAPDTKWDKKIWNLFWLGWALKTFFFDAKEALLQYTALAKLLHPVFWLGWAIAHGLGLIWVITAAILLLIYV